MDDNIQRNSVDATDRTGSRGEPVHIAGEVVAFRAVDKLVITSIFPIIVT